MNLPIIDFGGMHFLQLHTMPQYLYTYRMLLNIHQLLDYLLEDKKLILHL